MPKIECVADRVSLMDSTRKNGRQVYSELYSCHAANLPS
jgi:hypothetical protein